VAETPRQPGQLDPSQRVTAERTAPVPRTTAPMGTVRAKAIAEKILEEEAGVGEPIEATLTSRRGRTTTPMGTAASEPKRPLPSPSALAARETLTREVPPGVLEQLAQSGNVEVRVSAPEVPSARVWVATHKMPDDLDERLILVREPDSARAASFRVLRHRLQERGDPRVIAVTSAGAREGKTTCAVNLALALGECGRARVLLVESNLRAPALAPLFGFMPPECFAAQMLRHKEKPLEAWSVVEVGSPYLHVLAVKPIDGGRPLLDGPAFSIAMEMLTQAGYDYIVIDTPPVLGAADVNLIEDSAEGVLFTAWARSTRSRTLRAAVEQLAPAKLLGMTLLDV
jgi:Mrp family chromosome partitioning ATPase